MSAVDIALAAIVLAGLMIQTMTGFGFNVVAVTLGAWLLPIKTWLPIVVALNLPMSAWVASVSFPHLTLPTIYAV